MKLKKRWLELYQSSIIKVSPESPYYKEFKLALRRHLFEAQLKNHLPSQKSLLDDLPRILEEAERASVYGHVDPDRLSSEAMSQAVAEMMYTPVVTDHDESGDLDGPWLKVFGIISSDQLSKSEIKYIEKKLKGEEDSNFSAIRVTLVSVPITKPISEDTQDKINHAGLRVAQELLFSDQEAFPGKASKTARSWLEKAKQWWLFQTV